ncbi:MAG: COR domain-containing protein [Phormidesmis sp.]
MTQDELLRLIDEAAADGRPTLDSAGMGLDELPPEIGKLTNLKTLVLGRWDKKNRKRLGNNLKTLPDEIGQLTELRSLFLAYNRFSELPAVVGKLDKVRSLDLSSNQLSTLPESVGQLQSLRSLNLSYSQLSSLPESISQLISLRSLNLDSNPFSTSIETLPESIGQLQSLQSLNLSYNRLSNLPESIGQLQSLQLLNLHFNQMSNLPESVGQLQSLKSLSLSNNQLNTLPESIGQLQSLRSFDINYNQLSTLPECIGQLQSLQSLDLSYNQLSTLPKSISQLQSLKSLDLIFNELSTLPRCVGQLQNLQFLGLGGNQISTLSESIGHLSNLQSLSLGGNQLSTLPKGISQLKSLQFLGLSFNQLGTLPESIRQLHKLQRLSIDNNQITSLPEWTKSLMSLKRLDLRGNPLPIPPEILGSKTPKNFFSAVEDGFLAEDPNPATQTLGFYFSLQAEAGFVPLYEAKLILIGEGGAGKTSLARKIDSEDYELKKDEKSTKGIDVIRWDFPLPEDNTFRVDIWDFGGQEIYHATHQFFLTKRSLYLLVADTRQENTDFYYWLKIVELLSDSSPVLIIKNEKQDRQCEIDEGLFKAQFNNLKDSFPTNLKDNRGLDKIKDAIRYHISTLPHVGQPLPKIWVRVRAALENYAQNCNTITVEQYCDICQQNGFTDKAQMLFLSSYLHDLGVCLHFQDDKLLKRTVILKPEWATTAVYKVADSDTVRNNKGRFTEADTEEIWADSEYSELRDELLQLMMRFKLAYELSNQPGNYIAPQLLPVSKPKYVGVFSFSPCLSGHV